MLFLLASVATLAQANSLFNFLGMGSGSKNDNKNATHTNSTMMKQTGLHNVVALAANSKYGIYAVQADNKLYFKKNMESEQQNQAVDFRKPGKIMQLLDTKAALYALMEDAQVHFCVHPCGSEWKTLNVDAAKGKPKTLLQLGTVLGLLTDKGLLLQTNPQSTELQSADMHQQIKHAHIRPNATDYEAYVSTDGRLALVCKKDGNMRQNFLGEGYTSVMLSKTHLYAVKDKTVQRCKLPCGEGEGASKMVDYMAGKTDVLMATFRKHVLACNKGAPLIAVPEDN